MVTPVACKIAQQVKREIVALQAAEKYASQVATLP
jgi:hypothetical protein